MDDTTIFLFKLFLLALGVGFIGWRWRTQRRFMQRSHKIELELLQKRHELIEAQEELKNLKETKKG